MNISNKKLKKALDHYKNGEYESALKICEKFLEKEYSNEEALALEGDVLYKLGRIDDAIVTWKINSEYNDNEEATQRLESVDKERKELALSYTSIQNMSSEDRILLENAYRENIELKKQVDNSDLLKDANTKSTSNIDTEPLNNSKDDSIVQNTQLNVDDFESHTTPINEHTSSFESEVEPIVVPEEPKEYHIVETNIDDILESTPSKTNEPTNIDLEELKARTQHLEDTNEIKHTDDQKIIDAAVLPTSSSATPSNNTSSTSKPKSFSSSKKKIIITSAAAIAIIIVALSYNKIHASKVSKDNAANLNNTKIADTSKPTETKSPEATKPDTASSTKLDAAQATQFVNDMQYLISADSIDGINTILEKTPKDSLPQSAIAEYETAENFMKANGVTYYYDNGMNAYNANDYLTAIDYFKKAKPYAKDDFRGPTMLFLTATSYEKLDDMNNAVATYKDFLATYPDAKNYGPESLYFLANYYAKNNNPTEAKQYATELANKYPDSMYNNDNMKAILK
ncbi:MAG: tetratricopeptide repeat protein [Sarcina sp.]